MSSLRCVVVGSGIAGLSAAEAVREHDPRAAITMIGEERHNVYSRPGLAYLVHGDIPERQLFVRTPAELRALRLERITTRVEQLLCASRELLLTNGKRLPYDRLLLATGAVAVPPTFDGSELAGVVKLDSLDDARLFMRMAKRRRTAIVVGGGITAVELVEALRARGMTVHYFLRGQRYWADVLDESESQLVQERLRGEGVVVHTQTQVKRAMGSRGRITAVETLAGDRIPCHLLAVAIGVRPRVDLARNAGIHTERGIVVNESLQTSVPGVYAAGDAAEVYDPRNRRTTLDVLWTTALAQGTVAGANMAGARQTYIKGIPLNVTRLAGMKLTIIGAVGSGQDDDLVTIARGDSEAWRLASASQAFAQRDDVNRLRLVICGRRLVGALLVGDQTWSRPLQRLIHAEADITPLHAALTRDGTDAVGKLAGFYQQWEQTARPKPSAGARPAPLAS